ncbi:MAG TPA: hypothetical protein DCS67_02405 [Clostridiales bacterium UBA8960]|nr:hypothetical protein [Clostridiales bacterium UBA8960]
MSLILGHRGAKAYYAENTLNSFEKAIAMGADGVELDIHFSKDGEIMVFHDFTLERMCGVKGAISDMTKDALKKMTVTFKGQRETIPTLDETLDLIKALQHKYSRKLWVNIELKAGSALYPNIEQAALSTAFKYLLPDQLIFSSFDHFAIKTIKALNPDAQTGVLTASAMVDPWEYTQKLLADFYHPAHETLNPATLDMFDKNQLKINTYTVNNTKIARWLLENGVHAIISDKPDVMVKIRDSLNV